MSYQVEQLTLCDGWINTWSIEHHDGRVELETFDTYAEARAALDEFFAEIADEIASGQRPSENGYDRDEFRIVRQVHHD